ncbi:hypothetical protein V2J09_013810 [Rumex salicifolius]
MASTSSGVGGDGAELKAELGGGAGGGAVAVVRMSREPQNLKSLGVSTSLKKVKRERGSTAKERISKMPPCTAGKRSSIYRGVTRHRWTGRYEAHLWDKSTWNENQNKKGKQGAYDDEEAAARAYDLAALKYWGSGTLINFPVTDYSRDLEEMQNVSREEYLASLRRKSSGFSRGISKYRGLPSSRWESSLGHSSGSEYLNSIQYGVGDDAAIEGQYVGGLCTERKIDLTGYIKWWSPNKTRNGDPLSKSLETTKHGSTEDAGPAGNEFKSLERAILSTEPYQMPQLSTSIGGKKTKSSPLSALSILSKSPAYKHMQERALKAKETIVYNDEKENKSNINKIDHDKAMEKSSIPDSEIDRLETTAGIMPLPKYPLSPLLSAPLLTSYSSVDPLVDPTLWTSLMPVLPATPSQATESLEVHHLPSLDKKVELSSRT